MTIIYLFLVDVLIKGYSWDSLPLTMTIIYLFLVDVLIKGYPWDFSTVARLYLLFANFSIRCIYCFHGKKNLAIS